MLDKKSQPRFIDTVQDRGADKRTDEVLGLLRSKNRSLERLMEATRVFLAHPLESLVVEAEGSRAPLGIYENERSTIIKLLEFHDRKIGSLIAELGPKEKTTQFLEEVRQEIGANERLIGAVFNADDNVFARIREAQSQISRLMQENRKSRELLSKFKSAQPTSTGEGMDQTL